VQELMGGKLGRRSSMAGERDAVALASLASPGHFITLTRCPSPSRLWASADLDAVIANVTPDVVALLGDGVSRTKRTIVAALADRHPKDDVRRTCIP
jgi:hypothetical protein